MYHTECDPGTYGVNCSQNCSSFCAGPGKECEPVNGSCTHGCAEGYTGETCSDGELTFVWFTLVSSRPRQQQSHIEDWSHDLNLAKLRAAAHETEREDNDFCLSRSHCICTDPTSRERVATGGSNPRPPHQDSRALSSVLPPYPLPGRQANISLELDVHFSTEVTTNAQKSQSFGALKKLLKISGTLSITLKQSFLQNV